MSEVYLAEDVRIEREVAIKIVSNRHADYIERFRREAEAIMTLHHAHILPALDYGEHEHWHYLVMPYIAHGTLREQLARGPLTLEDTGILLEQIASALNYAHEQGIIHRDIKPSNILMRDDHYAYLADFGLAKSLEGGNTITQIGLLLGTPEYMAPELAQGPATISSDLYALGILLYQMVTGQLPFSGETPIACYLRQIQELPMPPSHVNPAVPPAIEEVILRVLDKAPQRRYQTANELAQAYINALTFPYQVEEEEIFPASHYHAAPMGSETAIPFVHVPDQQEKFVVSNDHSVAPLAVPAIPTRRRRLVRQAVPYPLRRRSSREASLPQYTAEPRTPAVATRQSAAEVQVPTRRRRVRYRRRNRVLISMTVVLAMLLLVVIVALILAILVK